jgi:Trp operon repressor
LQKIEAQRGLKGRLDDVIARAAIVGGNDIDDFLTRDEVRSTLLAGSDGEITRGQARLKTLDHFKFLKAALRGRVEGLLPLCTSR